MAIGLTHLVTLSSKDAENTTCSWTMTGVSTGDLLLIVCASEASSTTLAFYKTGYTSMLTTSYIQVTANNASAIYSYIQLARVPDLSQGYIYLTSGYGSAVSRCFVVYKVTGLNVTVAYNQFTTTGSNNNTGGTDHSLTTSGNPLPGDLAVAIVAINGPTTDSAGTWESDNANDLYANSIRGGTSGGGAASNVTLECVIGVVDNGTSVIHAHNTTSTARDWAAVVATFPAMAPSRAIASTASLSSELATIVFDNATYGKGAATNTKTISHTTANQSNRLMLVAVQIYNEPPYTFGVNSVTYNGTALSEVSSVTDAKNLIEYWQMVAPATGTHDVVVTLNSSSSGIGVGVSTWYNVNQGAPLGTVKTNTSTSATPTHDVVSVIGDVIVDVIGTVTPLTGFGSNQTQMWNDFAGTPPYISSASSRKSATSTSTTMSGTLQSTQTWVHISVPIKPSSSILKCIVTSLISLSHRFARPIADISNDGGWPGTPLWSKMDEV